MITNGCAGLVLSLLTKPTIHHVPNGLSGLLNSPLQFTMVTFTFAVALFLKNGKSFKKSESLFLLSVRAYQDVQVQSGKGCLICEQFLDSRKSLSGCIVKDLIEIRHDRQTKQMDKPAFKNFALVTENGLHQ